MPSSAPSSRLSCAQYKACVRLCSGPFVEGRPWEHPKVWRLVTSLCFVECEGTNDVLFETNVRNLWIPRGELNHVLEGNVLLTVALPARAAGISLQCCLVSVIQEGYGPDCRVSFMTRA